MNILIHSILTQSISPRTMEFQWADILAVLYHQEEVSLMNSLHNHTAYIHTTVMCHVDQIADHINRGLYGMMIIDPREPRPQMTEMAMLLNGYDLNYDQEGPTHLPPAAQFAESRPDDTGANKTEDGENTETNETSTLANNTVLTDSNETSTLANMTHLSTPPSMKGDGEEEDEGDERDNEIYTVNGKAFEYMMHPVVLQTGKPYRAYVVNMLEFDLVNSFHIHGAMYNYIAAGTKEKPDYKTDIVTLTQGDRGIMEFTYDYPGTYMFHAHQAEFTDLGWMGLFDVRGNPVNLPSFN
jgi:FtsP/CotA-like multicopper oxidase with cupredoxin domain